MYIEPLDQFIATFQWNTMKYRTDKSLQETTATLNQVREKIETSIIYINKTIGSYCD